jgi:hypothetical protein
MTYDVAAVHHVGVGETPASIAECYGCDALDLVLANPQKRFAQLSSGELVFAELRAGEMILVPGGARPPPELSGGFMGQLPTGVQNLGTQGQQAAGQVQQLYQGLTPAEQQALSQLLQTNGITIPSDVQKSVTAMANLGSSAIQELGMLSGTQGTLTQINAATSLIAGAVTLIPGAGLVLGAGIAGGLAIFDNLAKAFGWFQQPTEVCAWKIPPSPAGSTGICFSTPQRPYGPTSPTWLTIENFAGAPTGPGLTKDPKSGAQWQDVYWPNSPMVSWLDEFGTGDWSFGWTLGAELTKLGDTKMVASTSNFAAPALQTATDIYTGTYGGANKWYQNPGAHPFALAFDRALIKSFEYPLNGFPAINAYTLLLATSEAWNAKFAGGTPLTFDGTGATMVDLVVKGQVDAWFNQGGRQGASSGGSEQQYPPVTINLSNVLSSKAIQLAATGGGGAAAPTSTAKKLAVGGVVTGAALTALWLALGRPLSWAAFKAAFSHAWKSA